ncbi:MAG: hypothetical protein KGI73_02160 [Patescibacteria group bacterium]|nr:hypothetical protein [Patescibacteria group bacterium]
MKTYTPEERRQAKLKIPKPVQDFLDSNILLDIYKGMIQKNKLNWRQGGAVTEVANNTLLGLESVSELETNLHQTLPELSAATLRELIEDINDRVFKEAQRRVRENVTTPDPVWDADELGSQESEQSLLTDAELEAEAEKEEREGWKPPEEEEPVPAPAENAAAVDGRAVPLDTPDSAPANNTPTPNRSIVEEKLETPTESKAETVSVEPKAAVSEPPPTPKSSGEAYHGQDPYREPVE